MMIRRFEEISNNAWPAVQTIQYDGWLLRFANGVTKRSNSVNLLYPSAMDPVEKIAFCEKMYQYRSITPCFKIAPVADPADIDQILENRGYPVHSSISFQTMDLSSMAGTDKSNLSDGLSTNINFVMTPGWMDNFIRMNGFDPARKETYIQIMNLVSTPKCLVSVFHNNRFVGVGLGILEDRFIGLFDIVVEPAFRNRGLGKRVVEIILHWGKKNGAKTAYLQVVSNNIPALNLYRKSGFSEIYQYHYRMQV